jgi:penicillin-binding protein 2
LKSSPAGNNTISIWRIITFGVLLLIVTLIYIIRLFDLQVWQYEEYMAQAEENRTEEINLQAQRGIIYDRNGIVLAQNIPSFNITVTQAYMPDDIGEVQNIIYSLSELTGKPVSQGEISAANPFVPCQSDHGITQIVNYGENSYPFRPVPIACDVSKEIAMVIMEKSTLWPGIDVETVPVRDYPTGSLTANIIGFLGPIPADQEDFYIEEGFVPNRDKVGYSGIELSYQAILGGKNGLRVVGRDVAGEFLPDMVPPVPGQPGYNLVLTIDTRLQQAIMSILENEMDLWNVWLGEIRMTSGVAIAMNPKTGEILAMVSFPTYENNRMARFIPAYYYEQLLVDPVEPLRNHAVYAELPAGSVFKLVTATGALNEGVVTPDQMIETPGKLVVAEKSFYANIQPVTREYIDWVFNSMGIEGFGRLNIIGCLSNSSNTCFYKLGGGWEDEINPGLGICRLGTYARALGFGDYPGFTADELGNDFRPAIQVAGLRGDIFLELPETSDGLIPDPDWKRVNQGESWTVGDTYIMSVGQGYALATPIQILMSAATIANDGKLMEPILLREVLDGEGNIIQDFSPRQRWDLTKDAIIDTYLENNIRGCQETGEKKNIDPTVFDLVQEGMRQAVLNGTLRNEFANVNIAVAGKTGTAEYCDKYALEKNRCIYGSWPTHAWTTAYAPYEDPEIAVIAFVYNGGEGASVAGPIVRRIIQAYFELKAVEPIAP